MTQILDYVQLISSVAILVACIYALSYFIYRLWELVHSYYQSTRQGSTHLLNLNPITDPLQDNVKFKPKKASLSDQYTDISQTIVNSFKQYTTYNQQLNQYYQNVLKQNEAPLMDSSVLNPHKDNW